MSYFFSHVPRIQCGPVYPVPQELRTPCSHGPCPGDRLGERGCRVAVVPGSGRGVAIFDYRQRRVALLRGEGHL